MTLGKEAFAKYVKALGLNEADYENTNRPEGIFVNRNSIYMTDQTTHQNKHYVFDMLRLKTGGTVAVSQQKMSENDRPKAIDITVGAVDNRIVQDDMPSHGVYIYVSDTVYNSLASKFNKISISNTITMNFSTRNNGKFDTEIKNLYTRLYGGTLSCSNTMTERRNTQMMVWLVDLFCYGFITLITLIGVTNIINTINTSVRLRKREFAVLKSVGLTPKGFEKMLRCESLFYGLKALLYGLPVSIGISYLLYRQFASGFQDFQRFSLPWGALSGCVAGVFVIIFATMMYASVKVKDENIVDAIREENL
ncbi:MAG TPA: ABC transporter permease [Clostridia bacterium]|nr:ABC transporter permease [Clostridia bacterium]